MLQLTIREALEGAIDTSDHDLYLYRDDETVLYIGRSTSPLERLREHLGMGLYNRRISALGTLILAQKPGSFSWVMELRTVSECEALIHRYRPEVFGWYLQQREKHLTREASEVAEQVLIEHYHPCLNVIGNRHGQTLPERYRRQ